MFEYLVDVTVPICRDINAKKADYLIYDTTGIELPVSENNPDAKQQHINGHFCYAMKLGIITNGLGIPRHIEFFDDDFKARYPEAVVKKSVSPDVDKEIDDSISLKPVLILTSDKNL